MVFAFVTFVYFSIFFYRSWTYDEVSRSFTKPPLGVCVCMYVLCVVCCVLFVETLTSSHYPLCVLCVHMCVVWVLVCLCQMFLWNYFFCLPWFYWTCSSCCDSWWSCVVLELSVVLFNSGEFLLWFECSLVSLVFPFFLSSHVLCVLSVACYGSAHVRYVWNYFSLIVPINPVACLLLKLCLPWLTELALCCDLWWSRIVM